MFLGRHTCLSWLASGPGLDSIPLLDALGGGAPSHVIAVGDRRRVARVLARLEESLDLAAYCRKTIGERAGGRVDLGIGRTGSVPVMVVETEMGGPSTQIILREVLDPDFHKDGAKTVIRVGSCGALASEGGAPDLVVAEFATGWSAAIEQWQRGVAGPPAEFDPGRPPQPPVNPCSPMVVAALRKAAGADAVCAGVFSKDSLYAEQDERFAGLMRDLGCAVTEMELATVGPIADALGIAWGGIMATAGCLDHSSWYPPEAIERNEDRAIEVALAALRKLAEPA
ncbi:MAG: phosphorylase family protein [Planctomycetota bacterium]